MITSKDDFIFWHRNLKFAINSFLIRDKLFDKFRKVINHLFQIGFIFLI